MQMLSATDCIFGLESLKRKEHSSTQKREFITLRYRRKTNNTGDRYSILYTERLCSDIISTLQIGVALAKKTFQYLQYVVLKVKMQYMVSSF